jgi:F-type H+-transporting ATPase subunit alpha
MPVGEQIAILYCGTKGLMAPIAVDRVPEFQEKYLTLLRAEHADDVLKPLAAGRIDDNITNILTQTAAAVCAQMA